MALVLLANLGTFAGAQAYPEVVAYRLISDTATATGEREYTYAVTIRTDGPMVRDLALNLATVPAGTAIVDGSVVVPYVARGASIEAPDRFTVRAAQGTPVAPSTWTWTIANINTGTSGRVAPSGGTVRYDNIMEVTTGPGTFAADTLVILDVGGPSAMLATLSAELDARAGAFGVTAWAPLEYRIVAMKQAPAASVVARILVPEGFGDALPAGHHVGAIAPRREPGDFEDGVNFGELASRYDPATRVLDVDVPERAFLPSSRGARRSEAVIILCTLAD
ncbi:MAG: hypothetical protein KDK06_13745 [Gammaproteobacteria bacterium]|nr:hypothetical protein [Gammaproteobacteria bacterium]